MNEEDISKALVEQIMQMDEQTMIKARIGSRYITVLCDDKPIPISEEETSILSPFFQL